MEKQQLQSLDANFDKCVLNLVYETYSSIRKNRYFYIFNWEKIQ